MSRDTTGSLSTNDPSRVNKGKDTLNAYDDESSVESDREPKSSEKNENSYVYRDYSFVIDPTPIDRKSLLFRNTSTYNENSDMKFPAKLYEILSKQKFHHIISWLPHGRSFKIWNTSLLEDQVLPDFFDSANYNSFVRLLNAWKFRRITRSGKSASNKEDFSSYYHELFLRGMPHLLAQMKRLPKKMRKLPMDKASEPDFSKLPPMPSAQSSEYCKPVEGHLKRSRESSQSDTVDQERLLKFQALSVCDIPLLVQQAAMLMRRPLVNSSGLSRTNNTADLRSVQPAISHYAQIYSGTLVNQNFGQFPSFHHSRLSSSSEIVMGSVFDDPTASILRIMSKGNGMINQNQLNHLSGRFAVDSSITTRLMNPKSALLERMAIQRMSATPTLFPVGSEALLTRNQNLSGMLSENLNNTGNQRAQFLNALQIADAEQTQSRKNTI